MQNFLYWSKKYLFSSWYNSLITVVCLYLIYLTLIPALNWLLIDATFLGVTREACVSEGACWVFIKARLYQITFGLYPVDQIWRPVLFLSLLIIFAIIILKTKCYESILNQKQCWQLYILFAMIGGFWLLYGSWGLVEVPVVKWGGLMLTLVISVVGIAVSLPIGIILALGRRSKMPFIRSASIAYIELFRGVPLITILFMSSVMLPLFLPESISINKLFRASIGIIIFESAYMAEAVRGGLQSLSKGQYEAADSLGLTYWQTMRLVILPQALKVSIPAIVNTYIALFKDTTLIMIIGMFDVLGAIHAGLTDPKWIGFEMEGYVFASIIFWCFCFGISSYSQRLEKKLNVTNH